MIGRMAKAQHRFGESPQKIYMIAFRVIRASDTSRPIRLQPTAASGERLLIQMDRLEDVLRARGLLPQEFGSLPLRLEVDPSLLVHYADNAKRWSKELVGLEFGLTSRASEWIELDLEVGGWLRRRTRWSVLSQHGVGRVLQGFGTGHSSLAALQCLPVGTAEVEELFLEGYGRHFLSATAQCADALGKRTCVRIRTTSMDLSTIQNLRIEEYIASDEVLS
jgi:hypothetical protein